LIKQELLESDALFLLASKVIENLKRKPVFLIDVGAALELADNASVLRLGRVLKWVANSKGDKDIPLALGLGWTGKFFERAVVIAGDVFRDRYRATRTLGNSFESGAPFETFRSIVKDIAGAEIPPQFAGLLRVPRLTAGMYGENLRELKAKGEVSPDVLWEALWASWKIIPQLTYSDTSALTSTDLAELLLADGHLSRNPCPEYLELTAPNSFGANDKLYERFGLLPPRRDPTIRERFRNRLNDAEDSALVDEIAQSIARVLKEVCYAEILEIKGFSQRNSIVEVMLKELPPLGDDSQVAPEFDQNIDARALPKRLTVGIYLDSPDAEEFEQALSNALKRGDFLMVCYPQGALQAIAETELFRSAKRDRLPYWGVAVAEEDLCTLTSTGPDTSLGDTIVVSWINRCLSEHLNKRPAIPLLSEAGKKALGAIIASAGRLEAEAVRSNLGLSKAECGGLITRLQEAEIITKKKGVLYWDPAQDPLLGSLLSAAGDSKKLMVQFGKKFSLPESLLDPEEVLAAYSGVFQSKRFGEINPDNLLKWYEAYRPQLLQNVAHLIESDNELGAFKDRAQTLQGKKLEDWQDIAGDRQEIDALLINVSERLKEVTRSRKIAAEESQRAKNDLKKLIEENSSDFTESEYADLIGKIDGFRTGQGSGITQLRKRSEKRISQLDAARTALIATKERLKGLKDEAESQIVPTLDASIGQAEELLKNTDPSNLNPKLVKLNDTVDEIEWEILRSKVVAIRKQPVEPSLPRPPTSGRGILRPPPPKRGQPAVLGPPAPQPLKPSATEHKEQTFDISRPEQAKKLVELLQSPNVEIKRIRATFQ
jgi:hypothetical protein